MSTNSKKSIAEILFLSLVTVTFAVIICGSAVFGFSLVWKEFSRPANPLFYPSSWR